MLIAFVTGAFLGLYEISMNLQASNIEKKNNKSMMSGFHAFWSLGILFGATATSIFIELQISLLINILVIVAIFITDEYFFCKIFK